MKTQIPDALKNDVPQTTWGKLLMVTPVVMTVVATLLAGLASSEMTKAQYDRALGAQLQSKAGDQWSYFQAKKLRGAIQRSSLELLEAIAEAPPAENTLREEVPSVAAPALDASLQEAIDAIETQKPETEITAALKAVEDRTLAAALQSARNQARDFDAALGPANEEIRKLETLVSGGDRNARRDGTAIKMRFNAARYDAEAKLNQNIANLLELQVRKANISAERHHRRSGKFFFGMLAAQAAVIVSTFAIATQKRNLLWSFAAACGLAAIIFAIYVYLKV
jgi:hypothetical protein